MRRPPVRNIVVCTSYHCQPQRFHCDEYCYHVDGYSYGCGDDDDDDHTLDEE